MAKLKTEVFKIDFETKTKIDFLCSAMGITKTKLYHLGIDRIYEDCKDHPASQKQVHQSISKALLDIAIYLNSNKTEDGDSNDFFIMAEKFLRDIADDPNLNKPSM